ncbi:MAG: carbohydrate kinase family protein [Spirochaetota bacterium]
MIICIGESLIDFVPQNAPGETPLYRPVPGGSPMNCAVAAARLGAKARFAGTISTDFFGDQIYAHLQANGVDCSAITRVANPTTLAFVKKVPDGSARYAFYTEGSADRALSPDHLSGEIPAGALLQIGSISLIGDPESQTILQGVSATKDEHIVIFDPNIRPTLIDNEPDYRARIGRAIESAAIVKTSDEDLGWMFPNTTEDQAVGRLLAAGVHLVIVTRGAAGSSAIAVEGRVDVPAPEVEVSDTIGAGDSYMAALLVWLDEHAIIAREQLAELSEEQRRLMLEFAGTVSAITCSRVGADPPRRDELD